MYYGECMDKKWVPLLPTMSLLVLLMNSLGTKEDISHDYVEQASSITFASTAGFEGVNHVPMT